MFWQQWVSRFFFKQGNFFEDTHYFCCNCTTKWAEHGIDEIGLLGESVLSEQWSQEMQATSSFPYSVNRQQRDVFSSTRRSLTTGLGTVVESDGSLPQDQELDI